MMISCRVCGKRVDIPIRQGMMRFVPQVCCGHCMITLFHEESVVGGELILSEFKTGVIPAKSLLHFKSSTSDMRSGYERTVRDWLFRCHGWAWGTGWWYEPFAFELPHKTYSSYIPDFLLKGGVFLEVKGRWNDGDKTKIRLFEKTFSHRIYLIDAPIIAMMRKDLVKVDGSRGR